MSTAPADFAVRPTVNVAIDPVTRVEILDVLDDAFAHGPAGRGELIETAHAQAARPDLIALLEQLPDRVYVHQRQLWVDLPHVPVGL
ncbi:DUF2795 domain-containing protein [Tenggerimyces flavus]|uniref:DUF2795 domain-containing protein n=1 Tax=Tenggerimyces flavus TaxID=1708749 RepID=A0ABV7YEM4_9ACTN|nr:DUF2795 domain-containing protein [Tenggerimyces flavus]MBM7791391.1 hypothetical protein [Tenggerimyces flavus]